MNDIRTVHHPGREQPYTVWAFIKRTWFVFQFCKDEAEASTYIFRLREWMATQKAKAA